MGAPNLIMPRKLKPGATICVVAPASAVTDTQFLDAGKRLLEARGYRLLEGKHVRDTSLLYAGNDEARADDLNRAFADPGVDAVMCAKGGEGSARLLPLINFELVSRNPKIFVGYSDVTALQIAFLQRCGLVSFYGPMVATEIGRGIAPYAEEILLRLLTSPEGGIALARPRKKLLTLYPGDARGQLVGGCLSVLVSTLGTEWEINTRDKILFFEDVDERPYRIDRYLTQLFLANKLQEAQGILFGSFTRCDYRRSSNGPAVRTIDIIKDWTLRLKKPSLYGLQFGHVRHALTLPNGGYAELDATDQQLVVGPAVRDR